MLVEGAEWENAWEDGVKPQAFLPLEFSDARALFEGPVQEDIGTLCQQPLAA